MLHTTLGGAIEGATFAEHQTEWSESADDEADEDEDDEEGEGDDEADEDE